MLDVLSCFAETIATPPPAPVSLPPLPAAPPRPSVTITGPALALSVRPHPPAPKAAHKPARNTRPALPPADPSRWPHTAPPFTFIKSVEGDVITLCLRQASGPGFGTGTALVRAEDVPLDGNLGDARLVIEWVFFPTDFRAFRYSTKDWLLEEVRRSRGELNNAFILEVASSEAVLRGRLQPMARLLTLDGRTAHYWREVDALAFKSMTAPHRWFWQTFMGRLPDHQIWLSRHRAHARAARQAAVQAQAAAARQARFAPPVVTERDQRDHRDRRRHGLRHSVLDGLVVDGHTASASDLKQLLGL